MLIVDQRVLAEAIYLQMMSTIGEGVVFCLMSDADRKILFIASDLNLLSFANWSPGSI